MEKLHWARTFRASLCIQSSPVIQNSFRMYTRWESILWQAVEVVAAVIGGGGGGTVMVLCAAVMAVIFYLMLMAWNLMWKPESDAHVSVDLPKAIGVYILLSHRVSLRKIMNFSMSVHQKVMRRIVVSYIYIFIFSSPANLVWFVRVGGSTR